MWQRCRTSSNWRAGARKVILRDAFADVVPPEILTRKKMGFGVPLDRWFRGELKPYVASVLLPTARSTAPTCPAPTSRTSSGATLPAERIAATAVDLVCFERWLQLLPAWSAKRRHPVTLLTCR